MRENHFELRIFSEAKLALPREVLPVLQARGLRLPGDVADGRAGQESTVPAGRRIPASWGALRCGGVCTGLGGPAGRIWGSLNKRANDGGRDDDLGHRMRIAESVQISVTVWINE